MNNIETMKNEIKKKWILESAKNIINPIKDDTDFINFILFQWFDGINTEEDFKYKYKKLKDLKSLIDSTNLYEIVKTNDKLDDVTILDCIALYNYIVNHDSYRDLSFSAGYKLSEKFKDKEFYYSLKLKDQVVFFEMFFNALTEHYLSIVKEGVSTYGIK